MIIRDGDANNFGERQFCLKHYMDITLLFY
jgi:hypothetical protein